MVSSVQNNEELFDMSLHITIRFMSKLSFNNVVMRVPTTTAINSIFGSVICLTGAARFLAIT